MIRETPFGTVEILADGGELTAWRIHKDAEEIDPARSVCDRDDVLYVTEGSLKLELEGREPVVVEAGEAFVIPGGTAFRGYRWPRDGGPCTFIAVAPAGATFTPVA